MKPMLASEVDFDKLRYPCIASPKYDGIRVLVKDGEVVSRSLKPIRNKYVQELFSHLEGIDGELIVGDETASDVFQVTTSGVMSSDGCPDVRLFAFDIFNTDIDNYMQRRSMLNNLYGDVENVVIVDSAVMTDQEMLMNLANCYIKAGFEGIMLRDPNTRYKFGRATKNSQELLKWKPFVDDEFEVIGFTEKMHNSNEAVRNALGNLERSSAKDGLVGSGVLGALVLKYGESSFDCGTGFNDKQREEIWKNRDKYLGSMVKVRYQEIGVKDKPRFPSFQGFRDLDDISE